MNLNALKIQLSPLDRVLEFLSSVMLLNLIGMPLFYYNKLPKSITIRSGDTVLASSLGDIPTIWILPTVGLIIYLGLNAFNKNPDIFNSPQKYGDKNRERKLRLKTRKIRFLKFLITSTFVFITYRIAQSALGG